MCANHEVNLAYTAVIQNHFFWNNSSTLEPNGTKFYREMYDHVTCSPANSWRQQPNKGKMAAKKQHFTNFVETRMHHFAHFRWSISMKFEHKMLIGVILNFLEQNFKIFLIRDSFTPKLHFQSFFGTLPVHALQPWPLGIQ